MKKITVSLIAFLAVLVLSISVSASDGSGVMQPPDEMSGQSDRMMPEQSDPMTDQSEQQMTDEMSQVQTPSVEELKGMKVVNRNGEKIGKIKDVKINAQTGQLSYVTLASGGFWGMGEKKIPVPVEALGFDTTQQQVILLVDDGKLEDVPDQANLDDQSFERELESHYGISPIWEDRQQQQQPGSENIEPEPQMQEMEEQKDKTRSGY